MDNEKWDISTAAKIGQNVSQCNDPQMLNVIETIINNPTRYRDLPFIEEAIDLLTALREIQRHGYYASITQFQYGVIIELFLDMVNGKYDIEYECIHESEVVVAQLAVEWLENEQPSRLKS